MIRLAFIEINIFNSTLDRADSHNTWNANTNSSHRRSENEHGRQQQNDKYQISLYSCQDEASIIIPPPFEYQDCKNKIRLV